VDAWLAFICACAKEPMDSIKTAKLQNNAAVTAGVSPVRLSLEVCEGSVE
jgi:hypothetical protein